MLLADMGAEVIKIEPPHWGDDSGMGPPLLGNQYLLLIYQQEQ